MQIVRLKGGDHCCDKLRLGFLDSMCYPDVLVNHADIGFSVRVRPVNEEVFSLTNITIIGSMVRRIIGDWRENHQQRQRLSVAIPGPISFLG